MCLSTTRGVKMYGMFISIIYLMWSFWCLSAIPTTYQGSLHLCFWPLVTFLREPTLQRHSASSMTSSAHWRRLTLMLFLLLQATLTSVIYRLYFPNTTSMQTFPPMIRTLWIMSTRTQRVHTRLHPAPTSDTRTTSLCSCTRPTDKDSNNQIQSSNRLSSGHLRLRAHCRTVLILQTGMCLKLQPLWRTLLSVYRTMLTM